MNSQIYAWAILIISVISIIFINMEMKFYFIFSLIAWVSINDILVNDKSKDLQAHESVSEVIEVEGSK